MFLVNSFALLEIIELGGIAIEHIDVDFAMNTSHATIRTKLPIDQPDIRLVFPIACYPNIIVAHQVRRKRQIAVDKYLTDIQHRLHSAMIAHKPEPSTYAREHHAHSTHTAYLTRQRLHIEYRRKITTAELGVADEEVGLGDSIRTGGEEMIAAHMETVSARVKIILAIVRIAQSRALGRLDIYERNGKIDCSPDTLAAEMSERTHTQTTPVDSVTVTALDMLILGYVDAIDAVGRILQPLTIETVIAPFAHTHFPLG